MNLNLKIRNKNTMFEIICPTPRLPHQLKTTEKEKKKKWIFKISLYINNICFTFFIFFFFCWIIINTILPYLVIITVDYKNLPSQCSWKIHEMMIFQKITLCSKNITKLLCVYNLFNLYKINIFTVKLSNKQYNPVAQ